MNTFMYVSGLICYAVAGLPIYEGWVAFRKHEHVAVLERENVKTGGIKELHIRAGVPTLSFGILLFIVASILVFAA